MKKYINILLFLSILLTSHFSNAIESNFDKLKPYSKMAVMFEKIPNCDITIKECNEEFRFFLKNILEFQKICYSKALPEKKCYDYFTVLENDAISNMEHPYAKKYVKHLLFLFEIIKEPLNN